MSEKVYIQDDFGNQIPLLDDYGNLSMQVIMLYTEDKLKAEDRKVVDDFVATDEMSRDALEGYALTSNASRTRHVVNELNAGIQKRSGAKAISPLMPKEESNFDFRKLAAAIALLVVVGGATFLLSRVWNKDELADNHQKKEKVEPRKTVVPVETEPVRELTDSVLTEDAAQDKTLVDEVAEAQKVPTEADNKRFEEPNKAVVKEKKVEVAEEAPAKPQSEADTESIVLEEPEEEDLMISDEDNSKDMAGAAADDMVSGNGMIESKRAEETNQLSQKAKERERIQSEETARMAAEQARKQNSERQAAQAEYEVMSEMAQESADVPAVNKSARYPGGDIKMYKFIERKKNYPEALKNQGIAGAITVTFDVDTDGSVKNAKVKNSLNGVLDEDALRVVRSMPKWNPAIENGEPVKSTRSVVVKYGD